MPFFSIIIPIFNNLSYILSSINYLFDQSFRDFEIIIIDDGSTDGSFELCREISKKNNYTILLHQANSGAGSARNIGIEHAKGEYICFFDIDDKVLNHWLQKIYNLIVDVNPDLLIYSYNEINPKYKTNTSFKFNDRFYKNNDSIKRAYVEELSGIKFNNGFVWNKVYKRDFLIKNNIKFPDLRIQQDEVFNHIVYRDANSLITTSEILYDYYIYDKGNTRNSHIPNRLNIFEEVKRSFFNLADYWQLDNPDLNYYIHSRFVRNCLNNRNLVNLENINTYRKQLFQNGALNKSAIFLLENSKGLSTLEKLYLKSIIKKSKYLFILSEFIYAFKLKGRNTYQRLIRLLPFSKNIN